MDPLVNFFAILIVLIFDKKSENFMLVKFHVIKIKNETFALCCALLCHTVSLKVPHTPPLIY